jgi:hypothetical protein
MTDSIKTIGTRQYRLTNLTLLVTPLAGQLAEANQEEEEDA